MNGFKNTSFNRQIVSGILNHIIEKVLECFDLMRRDCEQNSEKVANNEIAIRDYLFCNYLNNDAVMQKIGFDNFRFSSETPENYVDNKPKGRADLQVYSIDDFRHRDRYFIIECKRVDGNLTLTREYVDEGIRRFVGKIPKYTSYYRMNCMLGFIVKNSDISKNIDCINQLLRNDYSDIHVREYLHAGLTPYTYISSHGESESERIILTWVCT